MNNKQLLQQKHGWKNLGPIKKTTLQQLMNNKQLTNEKQ